MRTPFYFGVGGVVSADIAVPEHDKELGFYSKVLTTGSNPLWKDDLLNNQSTPIIGLGVQSPEYESLPLQWMPHFQVADVAASAARAVELGAQELMHGRDDNGESQWVVLVDPFGAGFGIIPVVEGQSNEASELSNIGHIAWLSLITNDARSFCEFYEQVIGLKAKPISESTWEMQRPDGHAAAEITVPSKEQNEIPAAWLIRLPVDDFTESLQQVRSEGGEILWEADDSKYAIIQDPVGVCFELQASK